MKRPIKKDYCKKFALDSKFVLFDSKSYSKEQDKYIDELLEQRNELLKSLIEMVTYFDDTVGLAGGLSIINNSKRTIKNIEQ